MSFGERMRLQPQSRLLQTILWVVAVVIAPSVGSLFWWPFHISWQMRLLLLGAYWPVGYLAVTENGAALAPQDWLDLESGKSAPCTFSAFPGHFPSPIFLLFCQKWTFSTPTGCFVN